MNAEEGGLGMLTGRPKILVPALSMRQATSVPACQGGDRIETDSFERASEVGFERAGNIILPSVALDLLRS